MESKRKIALVFIVVIVSSLLIFNSTFLAFIGNFLILKQPLEKSDIIVVLSGDRSGKRVLTGVELFNKGYSDIILMIGGQLQWNTFAPEIMKRQAVYLGISEDNIIVVHQGISTYEQAKRILNEMKTNGFKSAIVVTSDYHTRRTKHVFDKFFSSSDLKVLVYPSPSEQFDASAWWKNSEHAEIVFYEYTKLIWYWIRY